jgi:hypothetical protein
MHAGYPGRMEHRISLHRWRNRAAAPPRKILVAELQIVGPRCSHLGTNSPKVPFREYEVSQRKILKSDIKKSDENEVFDRSNSTTFGRSVESEAQQTDAAGRSSPLPGADQPLHLYRLVPTASAEDPRWQNSPFQGEVLVAARTTGDARLVQQDGSSTSWRSMLRLPMM